MKALYLFTAAIHVSNCVNGIAMEPCEGGGKVSVDPIDEDTANYFLSIPHYTVVEEKPGTLAAFCKEILDREDPADDAANAELSLQPGEDGPAGAAGEDTIAAAGGEDTVGGAEAVEEGSTDAGKASENDGGDAPSDEPAKPAAKAKAKAK